MDKPTHNYNADVNSAWTMYNHITLALKESHPSTYMKDHQRVHGYFVDAFGNLVTPQIGGGVDPIDEEDENDVREDLIVTPAGSDYDLDLNSYGVNFL
jgi:hypothetical protein